MNFAEEIKDRVSMLDICGMYGIRVDRGNKAICPFHNDRHASMHVYSGRGGYWCFTCNEGGNVIDFAMRYFNVNFRQACEKLNVDFSLDLPIGREMTLREFREANRAAKDRKAKLEAEKAEHQRLVDEYNRALDCYCAFDCQRIEYSPERMGGVNEFYAEAIRGIDLAENALTEAEMRLYAYEHHR